MKNVLWTIGGFCAAATGFLVLFRNRTQPIELLTHRLQEAWADHHTVLENPLSPVVLWSFNCNRNVIAAAAAVGVLFKK